MDLLLIVVIFIQRVVQQIHDKSSNCSLSFTSTKWR